MAVNAMFKKNADPGAFTNYYCCCCFVVVVIIEQHC